jgi:hypothetical protein
VHGTHDMSANIRARLAGPERMAADGVLFRTLNVK